MVAIPFLGVAHDSLFMRGTSALSDILQTLDLEILPMGVSQHAVIVKLSTLAVTHIGAGHGQGYSANRQFIRDTGQRLARDECAVIPRLWEISG